MNVRTKFEVRTFTRSWDNRFTDYSYFGLFVPWTVRTVDCSYPPGLFVPWTVRTVPGLFVPWTVRTVDCSYLPGLFVPWTVRTFLDSSYHGLFVPSLDNSYHVGKSSIVYTVSQNPPPRFSGNFSKTVGNFQSKYYMPIVRSYLR